MPFEIKPYVNSNVEYVNPISLETLDKTLSTLQQKHDNAIASASALKIKLAELPLNSAEFNYIDNLTNQVEQTLNAKDVGGFKGYSYNDIVKLAGDIEADKGLRGRLRASKNYDTFIANLDANNTLPEQYKRYYKEKNKYFYDENENGNWQPIENFSNKFDLNQLENFVLSHLKPHTNTSEVVRYIDEDGNITTDAKNGKAVWFDTTTSAVTRITEQELREALDAAIKTDPNAMESLYQDFKVAKWAKSKGEQPLFNIDSNNNGTMTFEQFKESIFSPFYKAYSKPSISSSTTKNKNLAKDFASISAYDNPNYNNNYGNMRSRIGAGPLSEYHVTTEKDCISAICNANNEIRNILQNKSDKNLSEIYIDITNPESTSTSLQNAGFTEKESEDIIKLYRNKNADYIRYYDTNFSNFNDKKTAAAYVKAVIESHGTFNKDLVNNNKFVKKYYDEYNNIIDSLYYGENDYVFQTFNNPKSFNKFINNLKLYNIPTEALDFTFSNKVGIKKEYATYIFDFLSAAENVYKNENFWRKSFNAGIDNINSGTIKINKNSKPYIDNVQDLSSATYDIAYESRTSVGSFINRVGTLIDPIINTRDIYRNCDAFINKLGRKEQRRPIDTVIESDTHILNGESPTAVYANSVLNSINIADDETKNLKLNLDKTLTQERESTLSQLGKGFSTSINYVEDENNVLRKLTSEQNQVLQNYITIDMLSKLTPAVGFNLEQGYLTQFNITVTKELASALKNAKFKGIEEEENITIQTTSVNKEQFNELNSTDGVRTMLKLNRAFKDNVTISIPSFNPVDGCELALYTNDGKLFNIKQFTDGKDKGNLQIFNPYINDNVDYNLSLDFNDINVTNTNDYILASDLIKLKEQLNNIAETKMRFNDNNKFEKTYSNYIINLYNSYYTYAKMLKPNLTDGEIMKCFTNETGIELTK